MRKVSYSGQFKKDLKLAEKRGKDINKLKDIMLLLMQGGRLPIQLKDHPLTGIGNLVEIFILNLIGYLFIK